MRDGYEHDKQMRYVNYGLFNGQHDLKINYRGNTPMRLLKTLIARRNVAAAAIAALNARADRRVQRSSLPAPRSPLPRSKENLTHANPVTKLCADRGGATHARTSVRTGARTRIYEGRPFQPRRDFLRDFSHNSAPDIAERWI